MRHVESHSIHTRFLHAKWHVEGVAASRGGGGIYDQSVLSAQHQRNGKLTCDKMRTQAKGMQEIPDYNRRLPKGYIYRHQTGRCEDILHVEFYHSVDTRNAREYSVYVFYFAIANLNT